MSALAPLNTGAEVWVGSNQPLSGSYYGVNGKLAGF